VLTAAVLRARFGRGVVLRSDLLVEWGEGSLKLHGDKSWGLEGLNPADMDFLRRLRAGLDLSGEVPGLASPRAQKLAALLLERGLLKPTGEGRYRESAVERQVEWLSYFSQEPDEVQHRLSRKRVAIVGCGGTGSLIAAHLARSGVKSFLLIDGAEVDRPDLNRQLAYFPKDLGRPKPEALGEHIRQLDPAAECILHPRFIEGPRDLRSLLNAHPCDLVIGCADQPMGLIQSWIASGAPEETPVLFGGVGLETASIGPLLRGAQAKRSFQKDLEGAAKRVDPGERPLKASLCYTNTIAAAWIAFEAFRYLSDLGAPSVLERSRRLSFASGRFEDEGSWSEAACAR
jgi:hypothetical protein